MRPLTAATLRTGGGLFFLPCLLACHPHPPPPKQGREMDGKASKQAQIEQVGREGGWEAQAAAGLGG